MPDVNNFRDQYKDELNVVAVHMPRSEADTDLDTIKAVAAEHDIVQPIFVDSEMIVVNILACISSRLLAIPLWI